MKFGAVTEQQLYSIDLRLPPEPSQNAMILPGKRTTKPKVYVGAARWGDATWAGTIYPPKTPANRFRELYPKHFSAIELNATHYTIYPPETIRQWAAPAKGTDFKYCPKFPQQISHHSNFENTQAFTQTFLENIRAFEENLGPVFLQLSESFSPVQKKALFTYLSSLPKDLCFFLELRHPAWFSNQKEKEELFERLHELNIGAVITDAPGRRDVAHMRLIMPKLFLRFVCNALHPSSFARTNEWLQLIQNWVENGLEEAYLFLHPGNDAAVPELAAYWIEQLNLRCGLELKPPQPAQQLLF
jgi:uncharacterized protein YecE (DUF72 family)